MEDVYIVTGSNMGERISLLDFARRQLAEKGEIAGASKIYETAPWGYSSKNPFLNQVLKYHTLLEPEELLRFLLDIEERAGRTRHSEGYEDRLLDLDILFYGKRIIDKDFLKIPHPRMEERKFVLKPLHEISPGVRHPATGKTVTEMLRECEDDSEVVPLNPAG